MYKNCHITLASESPRRKALMEGLDIDFTIEVAKDEKETFTKDIPWDLIPEHLARHKSETFHRELAYNEILVTADTLVFIRNEATGEMEVLGKPTDRDDAIAMLRMLSGGTHTVITGVCLRCSKLTKTFSGRTEVTFSPISDEDISYYIDHYRPYDKAGSYGVQEWIGYAAISSINGSFYNVMGLPVHMIYAEIQELINTINKKY